MLPSTLSQSKGRYGENRNTVVCRDAYHLIAIKQPKQALKAYEPGKYMCLHGKLDLCPCDTSINT